ncbi:rod shape-determining protein MreC [Vibrio diazotrophicus]|uniref:Cell shape-determining protein MreC n=1 Tax=Vibrio diazotrophicus TaxID=685 RepID=A0A329EKZ4_VIBDI|nr:rod shape-determining protein MreC [Vibrio diazotrophicus]MCZ4373848.1 rod shape-determining protein MreC [Vibrio diazotrophicus]PNH77845.1 rod shape-determining protein MreC [Vibrio diazotrophicus]RAS64487.1 rod shape-determining protein MreC [Vibrio diazotrophicus]
MKPIFGRGPSLQQRLFFAVMLSASLMLADSRLGAFANVRYLLNSLVAPIQYAADLPRTMFNDFYSLFSTRDQLLNSNQNLKREVMTLKSDLTLLDQYREENQRLRKLLGSEFVRDEKKVVTEVMAVDTSPYRHQVVIDKGRTDGVYEGQPVINEKGIVGQVTFVAAHNSRVLLLIDPNNAIPVQNIRNDIRVIASGNGQSDEIQLEHIPTSTDIDVGDMLVTSGLGGVYPEGYPVAYITDVDKDTRREFASIKAKPVVDFDRLRYLLLIWPNEDRQQKVLLANPEDIEEGVTDGQ